MAFIFLPFLPLKIVFRICEFLGCYFNFQMEVFFGWVVTIIWHAKKSLDVPVPALAVGLSVALQKINITALCRLSLHIFFVGALRIDIIFHVLFKIFTLLQ